MKHRLKGLWLALCMALCVAGLTGCAAETELTDSVETLTEDEVTSYKSTGSQLVQTVVAFTDEYIEEFLAQVTDEFSLSAVESWQSVKDELGTFQEISDQSVVEDGNQITITTRAVFDEGTADVDLIFDNSSGSDEAVSMSFNVNYSLADSMKQAGLNTLMGVCIVFVMLVFLSFLISQFKHIPELEAKLTARNQKPAEQIVQAPAPVAAEPEAEEEFVDDGELVAVIAAAIAASENTSTDSFVVRSIRKSNAGKWKRA